MSVPVHVGPSSFRLEMVERLEEFAEVLLRSSEDGQPAVEGAVFGEIDDALDRRELISKRGLQEACKTSQ